MSSSENSLFSKVSFKRLLNIPPATKALLVTLTGSSLFLQFLKQRFYKILISQGQKNIDYDAIVVPYLQLIPNHTLFHPWTVITSIFIDYSIWKFAINFFLILFSGKFIERSWTSKELLKFILIVGGISNLIVSLSLIFWNILGLGVQFFNVPVDGNISVIISFLVVYKQMIPEHSINLFKGVINIRIKHLPFLLLVSLSVVSIVQSSTSPFLQAWTGFFVSWIYLRFYQTNVVDPVLPQPNNVVGVQKLHGDASETFSLVHFFPVVLQPVLGPIFEQFYELAIQLHLITGFNDSEIEQGNLIANRRLTGHAASGSPQDSRNVAERRRQVALKVLEERIGDESTKKEAEQQKE